MLHWEDSAREVYLQNISSSIRPVHDTEEEHSSHDSERLGDGGIRAGLFLPPSLKSAPPLLVALLSHLHTPKSWGRFFL